MDWLYKRKFVIVCHEKVVRIPLEGEEILRVQGERTLGAAKALMNSKIDEPRISDIPVERDFTDVFPKDLLGLPPQQQVKFCIDLVPGATPVAKSPYRLAPSEMQEFSEQLQELEDKVVMSYASSAVTYTFVYTDSEPGRVFWGAEEEISDGGILRVIVYGYDGIPMQPVAPPSPYYIPGLEEPQTPPYIPLEYEHVFSAEEQPLPVVDSPTTESPGYVAESDPEVDPEEYEDDKTEDGPVDYPLDGGDDGDDDDGDSSGDDTDDENEDEEDEEEEHLAPVDSAVVVPTIEPVSSPEETKPVIPPPSTDMSTTGARIIVRLQASISLPPEAEVERLLAMTTPSPSPPISLSSPSAGERLVRCKAPPAHSSPPPMSSPLLPSSGCPTQIQTVGIASTQALIDAVTAALLSPPLPPSLYIPPPVNRRDDVPEFELPPHKRLCLSTLGLRYKIGESSTARPIRGRRIDYGFVSAMDADARRQGISEVGYGIRDTWVDPAKAVPEIAPMTLGEVNTRVTKLAELHKHDTHDFW
ncbi:hypothetical protein Tco_1028328 [Tanacetum coccineum]|uniref:Reverse transcriptase domain-containing protein n=1 Tax=Tanacetum coccineum TaxID=301880 RepID=A0ABQ5G236_9ASTR